MIDKAHSALAQYGSLVARIFLAAIFLLSGFNKIMSFAGTAGFIESVGLPAGALLASIAIIIEIGAGILLLIGWQGRVAAWVLIVFTALATAFFHLDFGDQLQTTMFLKNLAIMGGLLMVAMHGTGAFSLGCSCGSSACLECGGKKLEANR